MITLTRTQSATAIMPDNSTSPWLAGIRLDSFSGSTLGEQVAEAAYSIDADIISPQDTSSGDYAPDPTDPGYEPFTTQEMVRRSHRLGIMVKPWTVQNTFYDNRCYSDISLFLQVNRVSVAENLLEWKVDGIITDYPNMMRRWVQQQGHPVAPKYPKKRVLECLRAATGTTTKGGRA